MKKSDFLGKLEEEGRLKLVRPSEEISGSYLEKAGNCLKSARILLKTDLFKTISFAKKERIDKQYYVDFTMTRGSAKDLIKKSEDFLTEIKLMIKNIKNEDIQLVRNKFSGMF